MNRATLLGHIGQDPLVKTFEGGSKVAEFSLATNERWTDRNGEKKERTTWHNIKVWGKLAEVMEKHCKKGDKILIEGSIVNDSYEDKDGKKVYKSSVNVRNFHFVGSKRMEGTSNVAELKTSPSVPVDDDLPF